MNETEEAGTAGSPREPFLNPIDLLRRLANVRLPIRTADLCEIEVLRILKLSGAIKAAIPMAERLPGGLDHREPEPAIVHEITHLGQRMLDLFTRSRLPASPRPVAAAHRHPTSASARHGRSRCPIRMSVERMHERFA
jgi:hypothetical protein